MSNQTPDWARIREREFSLNPDYVYMNNSTFGATLNKVAWRAQQVAGMFSQGCRLEQFFEDILGALPEIKRNIASLVKAGQTAEVGIVNSATEALSLIASGLSFRAKDIILLTDHEHTGNETMWQLQADRFRAKVQKISLVRNGETDDQWKAGLIERFSAALSDGAVKVLSIPWCTTSTGHILPARELCALARRNGAIAVIDATQVFAVQPLDFADIGCDFLVMNGHKYLGGPIGSGFIVARQERVAQPDFFPTIVDTNVYGGRGYHPCSKGGIMPYTSVLPVTDAIEFYRELQPEQVHARLRAIGQWLRAGLAKETKRIRLLTPLDEKYSCIMTSFVVKNMASDMVVRKLLDERIVVKEATEGGTTCIRISPHYWNTERELDRLVSVLSKVTGVDKAAWAAPPV
jgi:isopenicillin-N epimerase